MLRVCIIGCGAVGSLFAAHLAKQGEAEIWAYDVWKEHIEAINKNGLRLSGAADFTAKLHASSDAVELPRCDYGIVATKAIHTRNAISQAVRAFDESSAVCSVQNVLCLVETPPRPFIAPPQRCVVTKAQANPRVARDLAIALLSARCATSAYAQESQRAASCERAARSMS